MTDIQAAHDLIPDDHNLNSGTDAGRDLLPKIIAKLGFGRSVVADRDGRLIAGNKATQAAIEAGLIKTIVVPSSGDAVIVHQRTDLSLDDPEARELAAADNRASELGLAWDPQEIEYLQQRGVDFSMLWEESALEMLIAGAQSPDFEPVAQEEQGRLDERTKCKCPECGHIFTP